MSRSSVLVVGGGPAGSTAAALLARAGVDVAVFERDIFPRYHIGESILPACHPVLKLAGAWDKIAGHGFRRKTGQYFQWGNEQWDYRFGALSGDRVYTWQVERSDFDLLMLENAAEQGARVHQGRRVTQIHFDAERPVAASWEEPGSGSAGYHEFDYLIDASGRAGLLVNRYLGGRQIHQSFPNVAVWGYWEKALELPAAPDGATVVSSLPDGWVWAIPLREEMMSVGVVIHKRRFNEIRRSAGDVAQLYHEMLQSARELPAMLSDARFQGEVRVEQDYSYTAERFSGPGYFISGDAACFLDPLLSTGVHLGMFSALLASASICALRQGDLDESTVARFYDESYRRTYLRFLLVVAAVYRQYDGKDSYFWQAQDLLLDDSLRQGQEHAASFLAVVTGIADMEESTSEELAKRGVENVGRLYREVHGVLQKKVNLDSLTPADREIIRAKANYWNSLMESYSLSPDKTVGGIYVVTSPGLGLRTSHTDGKSTDKAEARSADHAS